ncbi:hypothetical protein AOQ88_00685 [Candidatus Riesia sp. GBBU]|nr:hypothetical protein AOQ88_00685 [Candidatus Riesia sp. GBBU]
MEKSYKNFINISSSALVRIKELTKNNENKFFRIYIKGGGCRGIQYDFLLEKNIKKDDTKIKTNGIELIIDFITLQYLSGSYLDYISSIRESRFIIKNPNIKKTCNCGSSFSLY